MLRSLILMLATAILSIILVVFLALAASPARKVNDRPWSRIEVETDRVSHENLFEGVESFTDGPAVTAACLRCHPEAARQVMATQHFTWLGDEEILPGREKPVRVGKKNLINNFCISIESNWPKCTSCHAGYGWRDESFDFTRETNVDCLVCHDRSGQYVKGDSGVVAEGVDLMASAKSAARPNRDNCGYCHFNGGGGNAVKHGDLDGSLAKPVERVDVHMGGNDFDCIDCHRAENHVIPGKLISVSARDTLGLTCAECHSESPHRSERLNEHFESVACQTCHIPFIALREPTKVVWDWSTAGHDPDIDDPHEYLKIKGSFIYAKNIAPEYYWFNGDVNRYLKGDHINTEGITAINYPLGDVSDPRAKIYPFKVHRAKQLYDQKYNYLLIPQTVGKGGFWTEFDWDRALRQAAPKTGLAYSGQYGFTETSMHWLITHMVAPRENALQCAACHSDNGRMDWGALGYPGDPAFSGGREYWRMIETAREGVR